MYINRTTGVYVADDGLNVRDLLSPTKEVKRRKPKDPPVDRCRTDGCGTKLREKKRTVGFCECCQRRRAAH